MICRSASHNLPTIQTVFDDLKHGQWGSVIRLNLGKPGYGPLRHRGKVVKEECPPQVEHALVIMSTKQHNELFRNIKHVFSIKYIVVFLQKAGKAI